MTPDEVRMLDNRYAILFIRGERPIIDAKYDILSHPNVSYGPDGGGPAYEHDRPVRTDAVNIEIVSIADYPGKRMSDFPIIEAYIPDLMAMDEEDLEVLIDFNQKEQSKQN